MIHGFLKACTVSPALRVADCAFNTQQTIAAMQRAAADGVQLAVFPELGLTGYTCGDLFFQQSLQRAAAKGLAAVLEASAALDLMALVGLPIAVSENERNENDFPQDPRRQSGVRQDGQDRCRHRGRPRGAQSL